MRFKFVIEKKAKNKALLNETQSLGQHFIRISHQYEDYIVHSVRNKSEKLNILAKCADLAFIGAVWHRYTNGHSDL